MDFRILGPLEVEASTGLLALRGRTQRALLAVLLLHPNEVVGSEQLIEELWGEAPPETAGKIVQNTVSQLRKLLGPAVLLTRAPGYLLHVEPGRLDAIRFESLVEEARRAGDPATASAKLREALGLWRGLALADVVYEPFAQAEIARLEDLRLTAIEDRIDAELALGQHAALVGELESLVGRHPLRERLRGQLMLALYRSGRQAEALALYQKTRAALIDELGIDPSPALQRLEKAILLQDPALDLSAAPSAAAEAAPPADLEPPPAPPREVRKTVSVLFADVVSVDGSADPERRRALLSRATETLSRVIERHGGVVEQLVTSELMAVFGVPVVHEDDALRAVRAGIEMREALAALNAELEREHQGRLAVRAGLGTGEVLAGGAGRLITGDVVAAAARLEQVAQPGEILVGEGTERFVRSIARLEQVEPVAHGGLELAAWRVVELAPGAMPIPRHLEAPLVGRERELTGLGQALERAVRERTAYLFTVLGPAGIGKSRLAAEFAAEVGGEATVLSGRCLPYGEGITFWPLAEIVRQVAGPNARETLPRLLEDDPDAPLVVERVRGAIGRVVRASASEDTFWAFRRLFEALARRRPLVLVFEDMHWAESTLLDLVEHVADWTRNAPVVLLCLARPELLEERRFWAGGKLNATSLLLEPLSEPEAAALIENLLGEAPLEDDARARITETAEGNPLFLEQMLAMVMEEGGGELTVPPTINALLTARLDRLDPGARALLERASVIGKEFWRGAVVELTPEEARASVGAHLQTLVRRELIRPGGPAFGRDEGLRFRHILIRDAAYASLTKQARRDLHERFAEWVERNSGERASELEQIAGYHLEQAYICHVALGPVGERGRDLAERAATRLGRAGRRSYARGDMPAAVSLLSRAAALLSLEAPGRLELLADLAEALRETGDFRAAEAVLAGLIDAANASGDRALEAHARVTRIRLRVAVDPEIKPDEVEREARDAVRVFEELGDEVRLAKAWELLAWGPWMRCRAADAEAALEHAIEHARAAGDDRTEAQSLNLAIGAAFFGPMPVPDAILRCREILARPAAQRRMTASALRALAGLTAMQGDFEEAWRLVEAARAAIADLGLRVTAASASETYGIVAMLAGDPAAAERELRSGYERLERMGESSNVADVAAMLAQALHAQGREEEALSFSGISESAAAPDDISPQVQWRAARAKALAGLGRTDEAVPLAVEAAALAEQTDFPVLRGDALMDLSEVLRPAGRPAEAVRVAAEALRLYEAKGHVVAAGRACTLLAELRESG